MRIELDLGLQMHIPEIISKEHTESLDSFLKSKVFPKGVEAHSIKEEGGEVAIRIPAAHSGNPLLTALHLAFANHLPVRLRPDDFWLLILQGFAEHIKNSPEELRSKIVAHAGKKEIKIRRDDFVKGNPDNPWGEAVNEFSDAVDAFLLDGLGKRALPDFSTTGKLDSLAFRIALLDAVSPFFSYNFASLCGIPYIELEGTADDWAKLSEHCGLLKGYGLDWWLEKLEPILLKIHEAAKGGIDTVFWDSIFKYKRQSGGPFITGWILNFFPYIKKRVDYDKQTFLPGNYEEWEAFLVKSTKKHWEGLVEWPDEDDEWDYECVFKNPILFEEERSDYWKQDDFPSGLSSVPFLWKYLGDIYKMRMYGGFACVMYHTETHILRPAIGWAVGEEG